MSRLRVVHVPFSAGHSDEVDVKLLPEGLFSAARDCRLPAAGSLRLRPGWRPLAMGELVTGQALVARDLYSYGDSLVALASDTTGALRLATFTQANPAVPWLQTTAATGRSSNIVPKASCSWGMRFRTSTPPTDRG